MGDEIKMYTLDDIKNYKRAYGWTNLLTIPLKRVLSKIFTFKREMVLYSSLSDPVPYREPSEGINIRKASNEDLNRLKDIRPNTKLFRKWLENDSLFLIALDGDKVIGYSCSESHPIKPLDKVVKLKSDEVWGHNAFILAEYRGKGIYSSMFFLGAQMLKEQGVKRVLGSIDFRNHRSMKIHKKFGGKEVGRVTYLKFPGFEKIWFEEHKNGKIAQ